MIKCVSKDTRICAMCEYWNGMMGPRNITCKPGGNFYEIDYQEENKCYKNGFKKKAYMVCSDYSQRF